jgi:prepilin-type N-terminal cleavage/methylation domain-containing protein
MNAMNAMNQTVASQKSRVESRRAFTLIELLVVIAVIAIIAAFLVPLGAAVKRHSLINRAQAELAQLETAIDRYHAAYGFYPPSTTNYLTGQLYYELEGTTYDSTNNLFTTLDGGQILTAANVNNAFSVGGFMNCNKPAAVEDSTKARNFLPDLKPGQFGIVTNNGVGVYVILTAVGGPDPLYQPIGASGVNPWRYNSSSPTNNPGAYDLWIQLSIGSTFSNANNFINPHKYLICNWRKQPQINSPLP